MQDSCQTSVPVKKTSEQNLPVENRCWWICFYGNKRENTACLGQGWESIVSQQIRYLLDKNAFLYLYIFIYVKKKRKNEHGRTGYGNSPRMAWISQVSLRICLYIYCMLTVVHAFQYFSSVPVLHYLQVVLFIRIWTISWRSYTYSLKSGGTKAHFRRVKGPVNAPYWKACGNNLLSPAVLRKTF